MISEGLGFDGFDEAGVGRRERMEDFWEGEAERRRRVPWDGVWRERREEMSFGRERPAERTTSPPLTSSRSSDIICSWNCTILFFTPFVFVVQRV